MISRDQKHRLREMMNDHNLHDLLVTFSMLCSEHAAKADRQKDKLLSLEWQAASVLIERVADHDAIRDLSRKHIKMP